MCKCHQMIKQCQHANEKTQKKATKECGFLFEKQKSVHLSQWAQKHLEWHHGMQSFPYHGRSGKGGSPWGLTTSHIYNVSNQEPKDGRGLT